MHEALIRWWNGISLRTKITGVTVLVVTSGLVVAGAGTMTVLRTYLLNDIDRQINEAWAELPQSIDLAQTNPITQEEAGQPRVFYLAAVSASGELLGDNLPASDNELTPDVSKLKLSFVATLSEAMTLTNDARSTQWRVIAYPGNVRSTGEDATLLIGVNLKSTNATISSLGSIFLGFGLLVVILGAALTRVLVTSTFAPLREVEATAARFAGGDFTQRLGGAPPNTEVGRLNRSLNAMLNRIDRAFADRSRTIDQMRRFVGDASHELRTPLVSVRGYAELYRMGALTTPEDVAQAMERIEKEAIRMGGLVEDLLELARLDEARPLQLAPVDLVPIANDAALDAMASAPDRTVSVVVVDIPVPVVASPDDADAASAAASTSVHGSGASSRGERLTPAATLATGPIAFAGATLARLRSRRARSNAGQPLSVEPIVDAPPQHPTIVLAEENKIRQVVTNLMGNAMRFTPAGSPIEIGIETNRARGLATISVIDHGEGIPPQIRDKIFQRFWRADTSRNRDTGGSGLGLAIVASIVTSHGGHVGVTETPGGGATFSVSLPLLPEVVAPEVLPGS